MLRKSIAVTEKKGFEKNFVKGGRISDRRLLVENKRKLGKSVVLLPVRCGRISWVSPQNKPVPPRRPNSKKFHESSLGIKEHAGGSLEVIKLSTQGGTSEQTFHVWTPPGYQREEALQNNIPVMFLNEGESVFSRTGWWGAVTAATLIKAELIPPFILASLDAAPGHDHNQFQEHLDRLTLDVMPFMHECFGASTDPSQVGIGGSGLGAMFALQAAMHRPGVFGKVLAESPSCWVEEGKLLQELQRHIGPLPDRIYLGVGGKEYTGSQFQDFSDQIDLGEDMKGPDVDFLFTEWVKEVAETLAEQHHDPELGVKLVIDPSSALTTSAWRARLPKALLYLMNPEWVDPPYKKDIPPPVKQLKALYSVPQDPDSVLFVPSARGMVPGTEFKVMINRAASQALNGNGELQVHYSFNGWSTPTHQAVMTPSDVVSEDGMDLWMAMVPIPEDAQEMNFVFYDGGSMWENNNGQDFVVNRLDELRPSPEVLSFQKDSLVDDIIFQLSLSESPASFGASDSNSQLLEEYEDEYDSRYGREEEEEKKTEESPPSQAPRATSSQTEPMLSLLDQLAKDASEKDNDSFSSGEGQNFRSNGDGNRGGGGGGGGGGGIVERGAGVEANSEAALETNEAMVLKLQNASVKTQSKISPVVETLPEEKKNEAKKEKDTRPDVPRVKTTSLFSRFFKQVTGRSVSEPDPLKEELPKQEVLKKKEPVQKPKSALELVIEMEEEEARLKAQTEAKSNFKVAKAPSKKKKKKTAKSVDDKESDGKEDMVETLKAAEDRLKAAFAEMKNTSARLDDLIEEHASNDLIRQIENEEAIRNRLVEEQQTKVTKIGIESLVGELETMLESVEQTIEEVSEQDEVDGIWQEAEKKEKEIKHSIVISTGNNKFTSIEVPTPEVIEKNRNNLFFTDPEQIQPGVPFTMYMIKQNSWTGLNESNRAVLHLGYNDWTLGCKQEELHSVWWHEDVNLWACQVLGSPQGAYEMSFVFSDGGDVYDNNDNNDFVVPIKKASSPSQRFQFDSDRPRREIEKDELILPSEGHDSAFLGGGELHLVRLKPRQAAAAASTSSSSGDTAPQEKKASRRDRWKEERMLRVWTPPGYIRPGEPGHPKGGYPVVILNDGKNLFEDWLAHQGVSWGVGETAGSLIAEGKLPPCLVVGIDSPGAFRSQCYLPYPPGCGDGGFRPDAARWPGGGVDSYMERVVHEIVPLIRDEWGGTTRKDRLAFGGGSFGGVCALYAAMKYSDVFGSILAESPSFWAAEGRFLKDMREHTGAWPDCLFMGVGTREYSATRDHDNYDLDQKLLHYAHEANQILEQKGLVHGDSLKYEVGEGAGHHEGAWRYRLSGALEFLCRRWQDGGNCV